MLYGRGLRLQMSKRVDCVEDGVKGLVEIEVDHVSLHELGAQVFGLQAFAAKGKRIGIQIQSRGVISSPGHLANQSPRSTAGFQDVCHRKGDVFSESILQKAAFSWSILEKSKLVPLRMIVPVDFIDAGWF